ncbi:MAG: chalcone isomerase family protein, partial [Vicinamibacteria bacterium]|nr:chalcone isomerase family protein [Vicinamibacteria bacterium]
MRRMTMGMAALAVFLMAPSSWSSECVGITMPDSIVVEQTPLFLNGLGLRQATFLKVDVYVAGLYLPVKSANPDEIIR